MATYATRTGKITKIKKVYAQVSVNSSIGGQTIKDVTIEDLKKAGYKAEVGQKVDLSTKKGWMSKNAGTKKYPHYIFAYIY